MLISGIILNHNLNSVCMSTDVLSYADLISRMSEYNVVVLALKIDLESYLFLDFHKFKSEQPLTFSNGSAVSSWNELKTYLDGFDIDILQTYMKKTIIPRTMQKSEQIFVPTPFYSNIETQLRIIGLENAMGFDVTLGNHDDPFNRTLIGLEKFSPDLIIKSTSASSVTNLEQSIPIVNGSVFYPEVWTNPESGDKELFAYQAGKFYIKSNWNMSNYKTVPYKKSLNEDQRVIYKRYAGGDVPFVEHAPHYNKGMMLIDFSSIGTIKCVKLSDCAGGMVTGYGDDSTEQEQVNVINPPVNGKFDVMTETERTRHKQFVQSRSTTQHDKAWFKGILTKDKLSYYTITFTLPSGVEPGIPILCLFGKMFFLHEDVTIQNTGSGYKVTAVLQKDVVHSTLLSNLQWFGKQIPGTGFVEGVVKPTLDQLFVDTEYSNGTPEDVERYLYEDLSVPFVIMLYTDKNVVMTRTAPKMTIGPDKLLFPKHVGGLLINKATREIVDYIRIPYENSTLVEFCQQRPLNILQKDLHHLTDPSIAFEFNNYDSAPKYKPFKYFDKSRGLNNFELVDFAYQEL